jgi:hypothetical protein
MKFIRPHWLTSAAGAVGIVCASLLTTNSFPAYHAVLGVLAALCTAFAVPTITSEPKT